MEILDEYLTGPVSVCPWCNSNKYTNLYNGVYNVKINKCSICGFVYSERILNKLGLEYYWKNYETEIHCLDKKLLEKRKFMYKLEAEYINKFIDIKDKSVLDVGGGSGEFLDYFQKLGAKKCVEVEYGEDAANIAAKKYKVYLGVFPDIDINELYDLVIFRGSLQYCINPKLYIKKALNLLKKDGILYITSSPNADSICFNLFLDKFILPVGPTDYYAYSERLLTNYIMEIGGKLINKHYFYLETPYANPKEDIVKVAKAIEMKKRGLDINFVSPAFYDNMLTLVYKK